MEKKQGIGLALFAFGLYIMGGLGTFAGFGMIVLMGSEDVWGWGEARSVGYLLVCAGLCFSILGILFMRIFRNRGLM